ncbi:MAG TPA: acyl carrier protein [Streptosporangiaceae bacterium]|nr:acyl carrier protein [Streptosporangiaceae bacterium]
MNEVSAPEALELLAEVAGTDTISPDTTFGTLSLDSLTLIEWVSLLEEKLDVDLNIRDLDITALNELSIGAVIDQLRDRAVNE